MISGAGAIGSVVDHLPRIQKALSLVSSGGVGNRMISGMPAMRSMAQILIWFSSSSFSGKLYAFS
jgi:hypothetical protein